VVAKASGGPTTAAVTSDVTAQTLVYGGGNGGACGFSLNLGCSIANQAGGTAAGLGSGALFFAAWIARRRRRK
jgi:hypothetical protein